MVLNDHCHEMVVQAMVMTDMLNRQLKKYCEVFPL